MLPEEEDDALRPWTGKQPEQRITLIKRQKYHTCSLSLYLPVVPAVEQVDVVQSG
jgi:hypothetical protein